MLPSASTTGHNVTRTAAPGATKPEAQLAFAKSAEVDSRHPGGNWGNSSGISVPPGTGCSVQSACTPVPLGDISPVVTGKGRSVATGDSLEGKGTVGDGAGDGAGVGEVGTGAERGWLVSGVTGGTGAVGFGAAAGTAGDGEAGFDGGDAGTTGAVAGSGRGGPVSGGDTGSTDIC